MGDWNTLHVFDDRRFHEETVPMLRGKKAGLEEHFSRFLETCVVPGHRDFDFEEVLLLFRQFNADFTRHPEYEALVAQEGETQFVRIHPREFYIRRFFEFVVFAECASFFPHFQMGKTLFTGAVDVKQGDTAVTGLLDHLAYGYPNNPWMWDGDGIRAWVSAQDAKVMHDSGSIVPQEEEYAQYVEEFQRFLGVVTQNNLGLLSAVNLSADRYEKSAPPLQNEKLWKGVELKYLIWP
ncbi:hypothetical protein ATI61_12161 [Archangium gephyra]|uniref:Uncharacterized protein n=1 Tax=Archangium gephyra TaxID=48 RepID=A0ABX9JLP7_9BACT|nr:hypothetical protein [Archangium gephyra]REG20496.1 hypothetical protein ATI61_12161 [Archangium gephyra]